MEFGTAKGIEFIMIFAVIVGGCLYQLHAVNRDARLSAQRRAAERAAEARQPEGAPETTARG